METQAHRLTRVGPRWTQGTHHLDSPLHEFSEINTMASVGSSQLEGSDKSVSQTRHKNAEPVTAGGYLEK